ncbi:response regulator [Fibrella sp. HMF5335]|uniref:Response regulator n=1 Tax=Fibrella rubiginis TaxID=2817060 RepID=A0A939GK41_9BACT|nr:response regulator [Fibrella rubiginis]MBO0937922.1 response regulator [Fibrella rubiginis]
MQTVLVVEDNPDHQVLLRYVIQRSLTNTTPVFTDSADQAVAYLDSCVTNDLAPPKLVLLDLYLPKAEYGWQFLRHVKQMPATMRPPVVVLSVSREEDDIAQAYQLGASSFISKPIGQAEWLTYFETIRRYWWETVTLPNQ